MHELPYESIQVNEDLRLIQLQPEQADRLFWLTDTNRDYLSQYLPWPKMTTSVDDSKDFINRMLEQRKAGEEYGYGIEYKGDIVGHASLMHVKDGKLPEIGYWISAEYKGRGITTDVATALTTFAQKDLHLDTVIIRADVTNVASNRVAQKCGYELSGVVQEENEKPHNIWKKTF